MLIWFWGVSALLAGAAAILVAAFARREAERAGAEDPALALHRRQIAELDELEQRGLLNPQDREAARAEAARRLLSSRARARRTEQAGGLVSRRIALGCALGAGALALALYLKTGAPGFPDQPFRARLEAWRREDPSRLRPAEMAAVLATIAAERPKDPRVFAYLGRADAAGGDYAGAAKALRTAARLAPGDAEYPTLLGEALIEENGGKPSADADAAFSEALAVDPNNRAALFDLGRSRVLEGRRDEGLLLWRRLQASLDPKDPRRIAFEPLIAKVAAGGPPELSSPSAGGAGDAGGAPAFIRGMVASLAARLKAAPNDPDGWARLVRSYGVLHDRPAQDAALSAARRVFKDRPELARPAEAEAKAHPA